MIVALMVAVMFTISFTAPSITYAFSEENEIDEIYYAAISSSRKETESFSYATKTTESYSVNPTFPNYYNVNSELQNTCANVAGANIIGYYDRFFVNLMPNTVPGAGTTKYTYYPMSKNMAANQEVINDLYNRMQTNTVGNGNTQTQYKNGISSYVQSKGYTTSYSSVMTNRMFDLNKAIVQFQNGNPISLYMSGYGFTKVIDNGNLITFEKEIFDGNHIAIAYGYEKVSYFDASGKVIRSEIYLRVSTGMNGVSGVYIVNNYGSLNDAEAVHIN